MQYGIRDTIMRFYRSTSFRSRMTIGKRARSRMTREGKLRPPINITYPVPEGLAAAL